MQPSDAAPSETSTHARELTGNEPLTGPGAPPLHSAAGASSSGPPLALLGQGDFTTELHGDEPWFPSAVAACAAGLAIVAAALLANHVHPRPGADAPPTTPGPLSGGPGVSVSASNH